MNGRQTMSRQWYIVDRKAARIPSQVRRLARGSGILIIGPGAAHERKLRSISRLRGLEIVVEGPRTATRAHNLRELRAALLARTPLILLSPICPTQSHPHWKPLPRMRAAAMARLAGRRLIALGGMDERRFRQVQPLGFQAWAGISAFRT